MTRMLLFYVPVSRHSSISDVFTVCWQERQPKRWKQTELRPAALLCLTQLILTDRYKRAEVSPDWIFWFLVTFGLLDWIKRPFLLLLLLHREAWAAPEPWSTFISSFTKNTSFIFQTVLCWPGMSHQNFRVWKGSPLTKTFPSMLG